MKDISKSLFITNLNPITNDKLLRIVGDDDCRKILISALSKYKSAKEIMQEKGTKQTSIYRRLKVLRNIGFLKTKKRLNIHRLQKRRDQEYKTNLEYLTINFNENGFQVSYKTHKPINNGQ